MDGWLQFVEKHLIPIAALLQALAIAYITYHFQKKQEALKQEYSIAMEKMKQEFTVTLEESKHERATELERLKMELKRRDQATSVAKLLSEWISTPTDPELLTIDERKELNKGIWEATLYLDDETAKHLNGLILKEKGSSLFELLIAIKSYLQGHKSDLKPLEIAHFPIKDSEK